MQSVQLDPRIVKLGLEVRGQLKTYQDLAITASGTKYANSLQNECEVSITNLDKDTRDYILTETSPFNLNKTPKILTLEAGRQSYGVTQIFVGNISSTAKPSKSKKSVEERGGEVNDKSSTSQPPDITVTLKCLTGDYLKGVILARNQPGLATLSQVSQQIANDLNVALNFQARDKQISNYSYSGAALKQIDRLNEMGLISAYLDDAVLIVKDLNSALVNRIKIVSSATGMIGIPEITEYGVKVKFLLDNQTTLGGLLRIQSELYPAANGDYVIYKLSFEIANRDTPFYWVAEAKRA